MTVTSVVACWAIGFAIIASYSLTLTWTEEKAQTDGLFLVYELLDALPSDSRSERLIALQPNFLVPFELTTAKVVAQALGHLPPPGEAVHTMADDRGQWFYMVFGDGTEALAAGPVFPGRPKGVIPWGLLFPALGFPILAVFLALRVERALTQVEEASQALAVGELGTRVDNPEGPSVELAANFNSMAERIEAEDLILRELSEELESPSEIYGI